MSSFLDYKFKNNENKGMADWQEVSESENRPISEQSLRTLQKYDAFMGLIKYIYDTDHDTETGEVVGFSRIMEKKEKEKEKEIEKETRSDSIFNVTGNVLFLGLLGLIGFLVI